MISLCPWTPSRLGERQLPFLATLDDLTDRSHFIAFQCIFSLQSGDGHLSTAMPKLTCSHHPWWPPLEADTLSNKKNVGFPLTLEVARHRQTERLHRKLSDPSQESSWSLLSQQSRDASGNGKCHKMPGARISAKANVFVLWTIPTKDCSPSP